MAKSPQKAAAALKSTGRMPIAPGLSRDSLYWLLLAAIILLAAVVRLRLLDIPLERDEGEYAYVGRLILQGIPPFSQAYTMKLPGTGLSYAVIMLLFGQTIRGIHLGLLLVNALSIFLLFAVVKRLINPRAGLVAALSYAVLSLSPGVLGFAAHATHFVVLASLAGTLLLLRGLARNSLARLGASGVCFGLAFIMKQHAVFLCLFGLCALVLETSRTRSPWFRTALGRSLAFAAAAVLPFLLVVLSELFLGNFAQFWLWTVQYAGEYATSLSVEAIYESFIINFSKVVNSFVILWFMAGIGLLLLFIDKRISSVKLLILAFVLGSGLAVCPGFYFRDHYFVVLLPAVSLLIGLTVDYFQTLWSKSVKLLSYAPMALFMAAIALGLYSERNYFFLEKPLILSHVIYGSNPFPESIEIGKYLKAHTTPADKIAVLGSEPQIYFYAERPAATGYLYMYGLLEEQDYNRIMQEAMIKEIETAAPKYLIFINVYASWLVRPDSETLILKWADRYLMNYDLVGNVDIISPQETRYIWGEQAAEYQNKSDQSVLIFKRKNLN